MSNYNSPMNLAAKASCARLRHGRVAGRHVGHGVMLSARCRPGRNDSPRKEEELIFRGTQYARAINQYQRKFANASPREPRCADQAAAASEEVQGPAVAEQRRRVSAAVSAEPGAAGRRTGRRGRVAGRRGTGRHGHRLAVRSDASARHRGGVVGVASKNTGESIQLYKRQEPYNEWQFLGMEHVHRRLARGGRPPAESRRPRRAAARGRGGSEGGGRGRGLQGAGLAARRLRQPRRQRSLDARQDGRRAGTHHRSADITASCSAGRICWMAVFSRDGIHAIREKHDVDPALGIDPQRRSRKSRVTECGRATSSCRTTTSAASCPIRARAIR